jgi:hypothetical protein
MTPSAVNIFRIDVGISKRRWGKLLYQLVAQRPEALALASKLVFSVVRTPLFS